MYPRSRRGYGLDGVFTRDDKAGCYMARVCAIMAVTASDPCGSRQKVRVQVPDSDPAVEDKSAPGKFCALQCIMQRMCCPAV